MAIRQVSFAAPQQQSPLVQALAPRSPLSMISAQALQEGTSTAPVQSIGEGLARLGQAGLGGWFAGAEKRRADEASGRLADAILGSMTPEQRAGPQGRLLETALRDPNAGPALSASYLQNSMTPRETWTPDPTGMFQVSSMTGERRPLDSPERARAISEAQRDPNSRYQIVPGTDGRPPLVVDRSQLGQSGPPAQGANPLAGAESSGRAGVVNPLGYSGLYQFGAPRLAELGMYQPGPGEDLRNWQPGQAQWSGRISIPGMPDIQTQQQFLASPEAQQAAFRAHLDNIDQRLGPVAQQMQGQTVGGVPITPNSLRAMAHLGGIDGVYRFLSTNGRYNPADANGTSLSDYGRRFANVDIRQGVQTAQAQPQTATDAASGPQYPPGVRPLIQGGPQQPFRGTGIEAQMNNRYIDLDRRRATLNPQEQQELAIVERYLTQPRTTVTDRGVETIQPPPMPRYGQPQTQAQPAPQAGPAAPGGPMAPQTTTLPNGAQVTSIPRGDREQPQQVIGAMTENANAVQSIDRAVQALNRYPSAVGIPSGLANLTGWGSSLWDRMDPNGVEVRAAIADIGSLKIHDRSGAAVSASEFPRLRPFIPSVGDSPDTVRTKLQRFRTEYLQMLRDQYDNYGPSRGYRSVPTVERILNPPQQQEGQPPPVVRWRMGPNGPEPETQ